MWLEVKVPNQQSFLFHCSSDITIHELHSKLSTILLQRYLLHKLYLSQQQQQQQEQQTNGEEEEFHKQLQQLYHSFYLTQKQVYERESVNMKALNDGIVELKKTIFNNIELLKIFDEMQKREKSFMKSVQMELFGKPLIPQSTTTTSTTTITDEPSTSSSNSNNNNGHKKTRRSKRKPSLGHLSFYVGTNEKTKAVLSIVFTTEEHEPTIHNHKTETTETIETQETTTTTDEQLENRNNNNNKRKREEIELLRENYERSFFATSDKFNTLKKRKLDAQSKKRMGRRGLRIPKEFALAQQKLDFIGKSTYLKHKLQDSTIQRMILDVDMAENRDQFLGVLLDNEPQFTQLCNELLYLVDGRELENVNNNEEEQFALHHLQKDIMVRMEDSQQQQQEEL